MLHCWSIVALCRDDAKEMLAVLLASLQFFNLADFNKGGVFMDVHMWITTDLMCIISVISGTVADLLIDVILFTAKFFGCTVCYGQMCLCMVAGFCVHDSCDFVPCICFL